MVFLMNRFWFFLLLPIGCETTTSNAACREFEVENEIRTWLIIEQEMREGDLAFERVKEVSGKSFAEIDRDLSLNQNLIESSLRSPKYQDVSQIYQDFGSDYGAVMFAYFLAETPFQIRDKLIVDLSSLQLSSGKRCVGYEPTLR